MSIRPLDMQVMIPKTQEIANIRHLDQQKANISQQNIATTMNNNIKDETRTVVKSGKNEKSYDRADAKKKGKNKYQSNNKKKEDKEKENEDNFYYKSRSKIDIRI